MEKTPKREAGWAAVASPEKALRAFDAWLTHALTDIAPEERVRTLVLARDYAVMNRKGRKVVEAINAELRRATKRVIQP